MKSSIRNALAAVAALSGGVPRSINRICYNSLLEAHGQGVRTVTPEIVAQANRQHDLLIAAAPPSLAPDPPPASPAPIHGKEQAAASAGGPTPLTYQPLSGLRPRGRNWWQGGAVAALLLVGAAAAMAALALDKHPSDMLAPCVSWMTPAFSALARSMPSIRAGNQLARPVPAPPGSGRPHSDPRHRRAWKTTSSPRSAVNPARRRDAQRQLLRRPAARMKHASRSCSTTPFATIQRASALPIGFISICTTRA